MFITQMIVYGKLLSCRPASVALKSGKYRPAYISSRYICNQIAAFQRFDKTDTNGIVYKPRLEMGPIHRAELRLILDYIMIMPKLVNAGMEHIVFAATNAQLVIPNVYRVLSGFDCTRTAISKDMLGGGEVESFLQWMPKLTIVTEGVDLSPDFYPNLCKTLVFYYTYFINVGGMDPNANLERPSWE